MNILYKRPLCTVLSIALGSFVFFSVYENKTARFSLILIFIFAFLLTFIKRFKQAIPTVLTRVCCIVSLIAILFSYIYFDLWFKAYDKYDGAVTVEGTVSEIKSNDYSSTIYFKTDKIEGHSIGNYKLIAYVDRDYTYNCIAGSRIKIVGKIEEFASGEDFDALSYYTSRGYSGVINEAEYFEHSEETDISLSHRISDLRKLICNTVIKISDGNTGGLFSALVMGERDYLPLGTKVDFGRIGLSHVLALSGMHLAILTIGLSRLLKFLGLGKKTTTVISIIFTLLYMTLTGFSVSVTRAGVMLICSALLYLVARTKDSMTSLFIAVTLIILVTPYAIFDTSLWLSAFATLGIVVFSEFQNGKVLINPFINWFLTSIASTFFAIGATFIFTTLKFNGIALLAPISTLIFSFLIEIFIYVGIAMLAFGWLIPINMIFISLGDFILYLSRVFSDIPTIYSSSNHSSVIILSIIFTVLFFSFFILKVNRKRIMITALALLLTSIFTLSYLLTASDENKTSGAYACGNNEQIVVTDDGTIALIDVATHTSSTPYESLSQINKLRLTRIDKYVFVNYSYKLTDSIENLLNSIQVDKIYLPTPKTKKEEALYFDAIKLANEASTEIVRYNDEDFIKVGDISIIPIRRYELGSTKKVLFTILYDDNFYTYATPSVLLDETKNMASGIIGGSHTVIFGCHESQSSKLKFNDKIENVERFIFSAENMVFSQDVIDYYFEKESYFDAEWVEIIR